MTEDVTTISKHWKTFKRMSFSGWKDKQKKIKTTDVLLSQISKSEILVDPVVLSK